MNILEIKLAFIKLKGYYVFLLSIRSMKPVNVISFLFHKEIHTSKLP